MYLFPVLNVFVTLEFLILCDVQQSSIWPKAFIRASRLENMVILMPLVSSSLKHKAKFEMAMIPAWKKKNNKFISTDFFVYLFQALKKSLLWKVFWE